MSELSDESHARRIRRRSLLADYKAGLAEQRGVSHDTSFARLDALMRRIVEATLDGVMTIHADGRIGMANKAAADMFGLDAARLRAMTLNELVPSARAYLDPRSEDYAPGHREAQALRADGSSFPIDLSLSETLFGSERLLIAIIRDITETKEHRRQLEHQALHDALTGLPNRVLLGDRMDQAMHSSRRNREPVALLLLDLDNFKEINDTLGHHIGDMLLVEIAKRLLRPLRPTDTVARLGGDEFAILLTGSCGLETTLDIAERIRKMVIQPVTVLEGLNLEVGVSIGVALCPAHAQETAKLMQCADVAMYAAKDNNTKIVVYDEDKDTSNIRHLTLTGELRQAIEGEDLSLAYQPIICVREGHVHGLEALARWHHPKFGAISPSEFIPQAERTGVIQSLTRHVLRRALRQWTANDAGPAMSRLSVNLSPRSLHDESLYDALSFLLDETLFPPQKLMLEITETAIFLDPEHALSMIRRLRGLGIKIGLDDFGTGFSSLSYLQKLPLDELKIDRSFVGGIESNEANSAIVRSTINLAHDLGLKTVAEGVETQEQFDIIRALGCDYAQGFHIARPMEDTAAQQWLAKKDKC